MLRVASCFIVVACQAGCAPASPPLSVTPRYRVTASPIDVGRGIRICIAVDAADARGVWWWGAGASGCASRSTGPNAVFHPDQAAVSRPTPSEAIAAGFRLGTHSTERPFIDVRLMIENEEIRSLGPGDRVGVKYRDDLDLPELPPGGRPPTS